MSLRVAIAGYGLEGKAAYRYFSKQGAEITILDEGKPDDDVPEGVTVVAGAGAMGKANGYDLVVRSPSIRPDKIVTDGRLTSVTKEFFKVFPGQIIGVTASKGKGTMASLMHDMLVRAGVDARLGGNIGVPALDLLDGASEQSVAVLELSSFQLWDMDVSPHVAIVGMLEPGHLDVHRDMAEYIGAKANIARWQSSDDVVVYHPTNNYAAEIAELSAGRRLRYATDEAAHVKGGWFMMDGQQICPVSDVKVPGGHNIENICAAISAVWQMCQDVAALRAAIVEYKGLEHRLELVRELGGVKYYDDSFSAAPSSAVVAAKAFSEPKIMIMGGVDRGLDLEPMAAEIAKSGIKKLLLIGEVADDLAEYFARQGLADRIESMGRTPMVDVVKRARDLARAGDVVVLSPGCASFDMFKDYKDRGEQYCNAVRGL